MAAWVAAQWTGLPWLFERFGGSPLPVRIAWTVAWIAPLAFCLGAFMPLGLSALAGATRHAREYIAWAWAVNGFFSLISSIMRKILAMMLGFQGVLLLALAIYGVGVVAVLGIPGMRAGRSPE